MLVNRFAERSRSGLRHVGHADDEAIDEFRASLRDGRPETLALVGEVITLDLDTHGALDQALLRIESALRASPGGSPAAGRR